VEKNIPVLFVIGRVFPDLYMVLFKKAHTQSRHPHGMALTFASLFFKKKKKSPWLASPPRT